MKEEADFDVVYDFLLQWEDQVNEIKESQQSQYDKDEKMFDLIEKALELAEKGIAAYGLFDYNLLKWHRKENNMGFNCLKYNDREENICSTEDLMLCMDSCVLQEDADERFYQST